MLSSSGVVLICVLLPWVMVYILNRLLKLSSLKVQYERFLHVWGISLSTGNLKLFCTCLNRVFARCSKAYPKWQKRWFSFGAIFGLTAMILSMLVLLYRIVLTFDNMSSYTSYVGHAKLVMVLPGINMPYSHVSVWLSFKSCGTIPDAYLVFIGFFKHVMLSSVVYHERKSIPSVCLGT